MSKIAPNGISYTPKHNLSRLGPDNPSATPKYGKPIGIIHPSNRNSNSNAIIKPRTTVPTLPPATTTTPDVTWGDFAVEIAKGIDAIGQRHRQNQQQQQLQQYQQRVLQMEQQVQQMQRQQQHYQQRPNYSTQYASQQQMHSGQYRQPFYQRHQQHYQQQPVRQFQNQQVMHHSYGQPMQRRSYPQTQYSQPQFQQRQYSQPQYAQPMQIRQAPTVNPGAFIYNGQRIR